MSLTARLSPIARSALKGSAAVVDRVTPTPQGITILIYHRVGAGTGSQMDLSPAQFDEQLAWLRATQRLLTLDQAVAELAGPAPVQPGVVLTFDDGTADWVDHALPAMERHAVPATFYVATSFIEGTVPLSDGAAPLSWGGLKELASSDLVTIGSHTDRHLLLDRLPAAEVDHELDRSIELLGERAGIEARHFAYPKALAGSPAAEEAVRQRFDSAVLAGTRANTVGVDPHRLWRSPVQPADGVRWFRRKVEGGLRAEDDLRRTLNRLRYRRLTA